jgi:hypothetical protein
MKTIPLKHRPLVLLLLCFGTLSAQDLSLFSTAGGFTSDNNTHLSWSAGEPISSYEITGATWLTQGYQQPGHIDLMVSTDGATRGQLISLHPNPASSTITLAGLEANECHTLNIHNLLGQQVLTVSDPHSQPIIAIDALQPGWYILSLQCNDTQYRSTSIIKL